MKLYGNREGVNQNTPLVKILLLFKLIQCYFMVLLFAYTHSLHFKKLKPFFISFLYRIMLYQQLQQPKQHLFQ